MTDIVERLRQGWRIELSDEELCEAADEIERLRDALQIIAAMTDDSILEPEWAKVARAALGEKE